MIACKSDWSTLTVCLFTTEHSEDGPDEADEHDDDPDADDAGGDDGFLLDHFLEFVGNFDDGAGDIVRGNAAGRGEEGIVRRGVGETCCGTEGEYVRSEFGEVYSCVLGNPVKSLLDGDDLESDEAVQDFLDRVVEDSVTKCDFQTFGHLLGEGVEGVVDCGCGCVHPTEDIAVDFVVGGKNDAVSRDCPFC